MATVAITANNTRLEDGESATGWSSIGSGPGGASEGAFPYQGSLLFNRKVTDSAGAGFYYSPASDGGSAQNMTTTALRTVMIKAIVTDYGGLQPTDGFRVRIGSGTGAYYVFIIAGSLAKKASLSAYPPRGGFIIIPIDPNIAGYRNGTGAGSPNLALVNYFGLLAGFATPSAKSENVGLDAIDLGTGLTLTAGDGVSPDGTWQTFVDADQNTPANRWGYASSSFQAVKLFFGKMTIGSATATEFNDVTSQVLWPDGLFDAGFSGAVVNLANASTIVVDGATHTSLGTDAVVNTRADYTVTGTLGTFTFSGILNNFRNLIYTTACTIVNATLEFADMHQGGASITSSTLKTTSAVNVASINDFSAGSLTGCNFIQKGLGHAIEITTPGTYAFDGLIFSGYGAIGAGSASIYNNSGGVVNINVSGGGNSPTYRNGVGATTTVNNAKTFKFTLSPPFTGYEWRIYSVSAVGSMAGAVELAGEEVATLNNQTYSYEYTVDQPIAVQIMAFGNDYVEKLEYFTLTATSKDVTINLTKDINN